MRGNFTTIHTIALSTHDAVARHFDLFRGGRKRVGLYLRGPIIFLSLWLVWQKQAVGFGHAVSNGSDWEFFAGRVQGVVSTAPAAVR